LRYQHIVQDHRWWTDLANHQPKPGAPRVRGAGKPRRLHASRSREGQAPWGDLRGGTFVQRREHHLGGHRRWPDSSHSRRRETLDEYHPSGFDRVEQGIGDRGFSLRCEHRVRGGEPVSPRRFETLSVPDAGWRKELAKDY